MSCTLTSEIFIKSIQYWHMYYLTLWKIPLCSDGKHCLLQVMSPNRGASKSTHVLMIYQTTDYGKTSKNNFHFLLFNCLVIISSLNITILLILSTVKFLSHIFLGS